MKNKKIIGVLGGVGPYTGIDLIEKILNNTKAKTDQDHLPVALLSYPNKIADRTSFLLKKSKVNPAHEMFKILKKLEALGALTIGIPCNTSHSPKIFNIILKKLKESKSKIKLLHMIEEVSKFIKKNHPKIKKVGLVATLGTHETKIYSDILQKNDILVISPTQKMEKELEQDAIYNKKYGIKSHADPVKKIAKNKLIKAIKYLQKQGAQAIILGCTEIPLAIHKKDISNSIIIDPTNILARALIKHTYPKKLLSLQK